MSDEVMFASSTMTPVVVYEILSASLRNGSTAASEPWLMSITMCPSASSPSRRMSGRTRAAPSAATAGRGTAVAEDSGGVMRLCYTVSDAERVEARDVTPHDEHVDIVRALVGVDGVEIHHVANDGVLVHDAGGAQDVAGQARGVERHLDIVHLGQRDLVGARPSRVLETAELETEELRLGDLVDHPHELLLDELERADGLAELDALLRVLERPVVAAHGGADDAPGDAVARLRETGQRALDTLHAGQLVLQRDAAVLEGQLRGDGGAHRELPRDVQGAVAGGALLDEVAPDLAVVALGPHHRHVGHRAVGDPELGAVEHVFLPLRHRARLHPAGVGAVVGLGEAEAADRLPGLQRREPAVLLRVGPVGIDGVHHESALPGREGAETRIAPLQLLHDEAVGHVVEAQAAVALEGGPEHAHLAQLGGDLHGEGGVPVVLGDDGQEAQLHPVAHAVADHPLLVAEVLLDPEVVDASEFLHVSALSWLALQSPSPGGLSRP